MSLGEIFSRVATEAGLIAVLLLAALVYQTLQLAKARKDREADRAQEAADAIANRQLYDKLSETLNEMRILMARLVERVSK